MWFKVKKELLVEALTKRKAMTANDTLILPYSLSEVGSIITQSKAEFLFDFDRIDIQ